MTELLATDRDALIDEITRYLAAVEAFRAADCEPTWRPEFATVAIEAGSGRRKARIEKSAH